MTTARGNAKKRKVSEMTLALPQNLPTNATSAAQAAPKAAVDQAGEGGGGGGVADELDEDEEEPSFSSMATTSLADPNSSSAKRFKRADSFDSVGVSIAKTDAAAESMEHASKGKGKEKQEQEQEQSDRRKEYARLDSKLGAEADKVARARGGSRLSKVAIEDGRLLAFRCSFGHIFKSTLESAGSQWCPTCQKYLSQCAAWAADHGGKLLDQWLSRPVNFECKRGHRFVCAGYTPYPTAYGA